MNPRQPETTSEAGEPKLRRVLGPRIAMAVVVGNVIGSGIFLKPGNIAGYGGRLDVILGVWVAGGVLCILGALCFAELATMLPRAGGIYVYLREAYGRPVAFLFGWTELLFSRPGSIGALAVAFTGSLSYALGWTGGQQARLDVAGVAMAAALIVVVAWVNIIGVLWGGRLQMVTTLVKAVFLALVAASPWLFMPWHDAVDWDNYSSTVAPHNSALSVQIGAVLLAVMWAYNGWHGVTPLAEEVRQPQRNIPLALLGGVGILIVLYLAANVAYHGVLSMPEMKAAGNHAAERMFQRLAGPAGLAAMSAVIMCSTFGAINTNLLQAPRIAFAMGRDGVFFRALGRVHVNYHTPAVAIAAKAALAIGLVVLVAVAKHLVQHVDASTIAGELPRRITEGLQQGSIFDLLTNLVIFSVSIFYSLAVLALVILRVRRPDAERPYKTWGYPLTPLLFLAVYAWFLSQVYHGNPLESLTGLVLIGVGIPVYFAYRAWGATAARATAED